MKYYKTEIWTDKNTNIADRKFMKAIWIFFYTLTEIEMFSWWKVEFVKETYSGTKEQKKNLVWNKKIKSNNVKCQILLLLRIVHKKMKSLINYKYIGY